MARKTSFYYSFLVLPASQRRAIIAVWDICRAIDDAVDESTSGGAEAVAFWRAEVDRCFSGETPLTEQGQKLQPFVRPFDLPKQAFVDVIDGVAMDLETTRYSTFDDLLEYCKRVASAVGLICVNIFDCRGPGATEYAVQLGIALQLTNILRDVKDDWSKGRVYLPLEDLERFGCTVEDIATGVTSPPSGGISPKMRALIEFECRRARDYYARALAARPVADRKRLVASEIMRAVYFETLRRIERRNYDVFTGRARVPRPLQAAIALRQLLWPS
jgi:phytoene synthase